MGQTPDHDDLVDLLGRTTDKDGWLDPILEDAAGGAVLGAVVEVFARTSAAADYDANLALISQAPGGEQGTTILTLARQAGGTSGVVPMGYVFTDRRGVRATVQTPIPVGAGDLQVLVPVQTVRKTEAVNTEDDPGFFIAADAGVALDGLGSTALLAPPGNPAAVSTTFTTVAEADPIRGGAADWLSVHGRERGQVRQTGESVDSFRARVRNIPDVVSPRAIGEAVQGAASRAGLDGFMVLEPFEDDASPAVKGPPGLGTFRPIFTDSGDCCGDTTVELVDRRTARAYFRISPPPGPRRAPDGFGLFADDGFLDDFVNGFVDTGGTNPTLLASLMSIWEEANRKRAGGVQFDLYSTEVAALVYRGERTSGSEQVAWTATPPTGRVWRWVSGGFGHGYGGVPQPTTLPLPAASHRIRITYADATTFTTPAFTDFWEERLALQRLLDIGGRHDPIAQVEGLLTGDGVHPLNLAGALYLIDIAA